jgi:hypothetical protein
VDSHEKWLETLEKAAGAGLEELQKQSIEASKKADEAAAARRAAAEKRQVRNSVNYLYFKLCTRSYVLSIYREKKKM